MKNSGDISNTLPHMKMISTEDCHIENSGNFQFGATNLHMIKYNDALLDNSVREMG